VSDFKFKTKPFAHQLKVFMESRRKRNFALLMEQGTGKTKVALDTAAYLYLNGKIDTLVVIAPNGVHRNWVNKEVPIHMACDYKATFYSAQMKKTQQENFDAVLEYKDGLRIFSFNVEAFTSTVAQKAMMKVLKNNKVMMVVDESSKIKTPGAKRTKLITFFGRSAVCRRILTGTPVTKGPEDLFAQFKFLNPDILGFTAFYKFRARYCIMGGFENRQIVAYQNTEELTEKVKQSSYRVLKKDCLDLPAKIYQRHYVSMSKAQEKLYNEIKRDFITELNGNEIQAPEAITRLLRLQQILCGWFPTEHSIEPIDKINLRLKGLEEVLSNITGKVIIWARFRADLKAIEGLLGSQAVSYHGGVSDDDREEAVSRFQNDDKVRYFISNPQAGGTGLTLTAAEYAIYYSNSFDLEQRLQSEDRCHRIGTTGNVTYIDIECQKSIDTKIIKALRDKKNLADIITKDPRSLFME
jgi:SNF2 family DNA or RNA helicase